MKFLTYTEYLQRDDDIPHNLRGAAAEPYHRSHRSVLNRSLSSWEALAIVFCILMNTGVLTNTTDALGVAGSAAIVAFILVALVAICVMTALSEMVSLFPIPNAMTEYVYHFVDYDLAILVGLLHWLAYSMLFATMIVSASNLLLYSFGISPPASVCIALGVAFYSAVTNLLPVRLVGQITIVSAVFKIGLLAAMLAVSTYGTTQSRISSSENTFGSDGITTHSDGEAIIRALSLAVFPFIGVESIAVTAAEIFKPASSNRNVAYVVGLAIVVALWTLVASDLSIGRADPIMADYKTQGLGGIIAYPKHRGDAEITNLPAPLAIFQRLGLSRQYFEICWVTSIFISANATLYLASRVLFGISLHICRDKSIWGYFARLSGLTKVSGRNRVPLAAVFASFISFVWVIILATAQPTTYLTVYVTNVLASMAIMSIVLVWASQCIAFLSYRYSYKRYSSSLRGQIHELLRNDRWQSWGLSILSPLAACFGLLGCLALIVILMCVALLNDISDDEMALSAGVYPIPLLLMVTWVLMKVNRVVTADKKRRLNTISGKVGCELSYKIIRSLAFPDRMDQNRFEKTIFRLKSQIYPADYPVEPEISQDIDSQDNSPEPYIRSPDLARTTLRPTRYQPVSLNDPDIMDITIATHTLQVETVGTFKVESH